MPHQVPPKVGVFLRADHPCHGAAMSPVSDLHDPGWLGASRRVETIGAEAPIYLPEGEIRVGTASWTDPTMTRPGVFYPRGVTTAEERLRYYASRFPLVEVDATYYALPSVETAWRWVERTPPGFVFDVKAHALMTGQPSEPKRLPAAIRQALPPEVAQRSRLYAHDLPRELLDEVWSTFRRVVEPLRQSGKLGAVLLQYPRWVLPSSQTRERILESRSRLDGFPVAVEFRHSSWFNQKNAERTLRFLEEHGLPYLIVDEPQGLKSSVPPVVATTSPELAVFRFHGRRSETWEQPNITTAERFRYLYDPDQLADWAPAILAVARRVRRTHVVMNNCFANYAAVNATELAELLRELVERSP
jgi:uncharacterized protein YecE (DUF72 family)